MPTVITGSIQASPARQLVDGHFQRREWQQALDALESILRGGEGRPSDLLLRARILTNMKRYEDAIAQAHNAAAALGDSAGIANVLKTCHFHLGAVEEAIAHGQAAIERRDRDSREALAPVSLSRNDSGKDVIAFSLWGLATPTAWARRSMRASAPISIPAGRPASMSAPTCPLGSSAC